MRPIALFLALAAFHPVDSSFAASADGSYKGIVEGAFAPDFELALLNSDSTVSLTDYRGKPIVLIFGSFT